MTKSSAVNGLELIDQAIASTGATHVFGLFSGGDDSLTALSVAAQHPAFTAAVHIDTGIGVWDDPDDRRSVARKFVERTCAERGWPLLVYEAAQNVKANGTPDAQVYERIVMKHGFPGPTETAHRAMYIRLKDRAIERLIRDHRTIPAQRFVLVAGARAEESARRMGSTIPVSLHRASRGQVWVNVIHDYTKRDCLDCIKRGGFERNPCSIKIHKSGECMCGAFAQDGELDCEIKLFYPEFVAYMRDLEQRVWDAGFPWRWDQRRPQWFEDQQRGQAFMFDMKPDAPMPMCHKCAGGDDDQISAV